jgi:hypothetical protein
MDQTSVEEHLEIPSDLTGETRWEGNEFVFHPTVALEKGSKYVFRLSREAKTKNGELLGKDFDFTFNISGAPSVSARIPAPDLKDVPPDAEITIVFDRPIVPLTQLQGAAAERLSNWPVTITPAVQGSWRWLSTMAISFTPSKQLSPATTYKVNVPVGIETVAREKTEQDFSWQFETIRPAVQETNPHTGHDLAGPTTPITIHFNQEMDLASAASHITLVEWPNAIYKERTVTDQYGQMIDQSQKAPGPKRGEERAVALKQIQYGTVPGENGRPVQDKRTLVVTPQKPLSFETEYGLLVKNGIQGTEGNLGSVDDYATWFQTVGKLQVQSAQYDQYGRIEVIFSNPVSSGSIAKTITLTPEPKNWKELAIEPTPWSDERNVEIYPWLEPSTLYTLTVAAETIDKFGQKLGTPYTYKFETKPLPPEVYIHSKGEFGIFERGKPPVYYVNGVNVSRFDLKLAQLSLDDFIETRNMKRSSYNYVPNLEGKPSYKAWSIKPPKAKKNEWEIVPLDVEKESGQTLPVGIYALTLQAPEYVTSDGIPGTAQQYFALTNMAITLKYSGSKVLAWVTDMQTGNPIQNATVRVRSLDTVTRAEGRTDKQGFFEQTINIKEFTNSVNDYYYEMPEFWVTAEKDGDFAFVSSNWNDGMQAWEFDLWNDQQTPSSPPERMDAYLYTERPLYKAGDTVHFKGIIRLRDWSGKHRIPTKEETALVTVNDSNGNKVYEKTLTVSEFGSINDSFPIDAKAPLGYYSITVQLLPEARFGMNQSYASFSVLAYRKPEYSVELTAEKEEYADGETIKVHVQGNYYFGAPLANASLNWRAQTTDYYFNRYTDGWYSFALEDAWCWYGCDRETEPISEGTGKLDAAGRFSVSLPMNIQTKGVSQIATIEADVSDPNNQVVSGRVSVPVHKSALYVGVRMDDYVVTPGQKAKVSVVTVRPDGTPYPNQKIQLQLFSRVWNTVQKKGVDGEYYYESEPKDTFIRDVYVTTNAQGKGTAEVLVDAGGEFRIVASGKDESGRAAKAGTNLYAWSSTYVNWPHTNNNRVDVETDKPEYKPGETAKLLVKSPFQGKGVKALVTLERENVIWKKVVDVDSNALPIEVPITEDLIPNAFVSVVILKPRIGETFNEHGLDTGAPAFRIGYARIDVEKKQKELAIDIATDKEQYLPGETVKVTLTATNAAGKPARAEVSLAAVDMSLLAILGFEMPNVVETFYSDRGLGVSTAQMLTYLLERFKPGSKGGGGGDLEDRKRGTFKDTAYWTPSVITGVDGKATLTFKLPDNLTTWQFLAIGHTKDHTFGIGKKEVLETKRVIVRPVRPRFAVRGDEIQLGAIVHNNLQGSETFTVTLGGSGFVATGKTSQQITVEKGALKKVLFPVRIENVDQLTLNFKAETKGARDELEEKIPVFIFGTPQTVTTTGVTENAIKEQVVAPSKRDADHGELLVSVSPTLATYIPDGLEYLAKFPYGCAEQTVSALLPNVALESLQGFEQFRFVDPKTLETNIIAGLERLYEYQRGDGGFGYWTEGDRSYPYLTAYIVYALQIIKQKHTVDDGVLARARAYLQQSLRDQDLTRTLDLTTRSYILFVLSEGGSADANLASNLYDRRDKLPLFAKAYLAMTLRKAGNTDKAKQVMNEIMANAKNDPRGSYFEEKNENLYSSLMHTNTRTTAIVLQALVRIDPQHPLMPNVVRRLLAVRERGHWDTTQSTTASLLSLAEYLKATKELSGSFEAAVEVNGEEMIRRMFTEKNILSRLESALSLDDLKRGAMNEVTIGKNGTGKLYYDVVLSYFYTSDTLPPLEQGMGITRKMEPLEGQSSDVKVGNTYRVTLTMTVPEDRHFVAVESPLPAGLESIDLSTAIAQQALLEDQQNSVTDWWSNTPLSRAQWAFNHKEYRDDSVFLFADQLPAGVYQYEYLVRATTPGTFHERPARMWEMYYPENFGQTSGQLFTVKE